MDPGGRPCYDGGISVGAQESSWTSWPWAEPSRPRGTPGTAAPAGSVSSATAQAVSWWPCWTLSPGPCLTSAQPPLCSSPLSIIAAPFNIPISPSLMSPGASPPHRGPTPPSGTGWYRPCVRHKSPMAVSEESGPQAGPLNTPGPDGRGILGPDAAAWGPLHRPGRQACPWPWQHGRGG